MDFLDYIFRLRFFRLQCLKVLSMKEQPAKIRKNFPAAALKAEIKQGPRRICREMNAAQRSCKL